MNELMPALETSKIDSIHTAVLRAKKIVDYSFYYLRYKSYYFVISPDARVKSSLYPSNIAFYVYHYLLFMNFFGDTSFDVQEVVGFFCFKNKRELVKVLQFLEENKMIVFKDFNPEVITFHLPEHMIEPAKPKEPKTTPLTEELLEKVCEAISEKFEELDSTIESINASILELKDEINNNNKIKKEYERLKIGLDNFIANYASSDPSLPNLTETKKSIISEVKDTNIDCDPHKLNALRRILKMN